MMDGQRRTSSMGTGGEKPSHVQEKAREASQRKAMLGNRADSRAQRPSSNFGSADVVSLGASSENCLLRVMGPETTHTLMKNEVKKQR